MNERRVTNGSLGRGTLYAALLFMVVLCVVYGVVVYGAEAFTALYPHATGATTIESGGFTVDVSNASEGYIMMKHRGTSTRLKARVVFDGTTTATYDVSGEGTGEYEVFPLQLGSGKYQVLGFENVEGSSYSQVLKQSFKVELPDPDRTFLYPNVYVNYTAESLAVAKSYELCEGLETDQEKLEAIYDWVSSNVLYDYVKAITVQKTYMPDVDETLTTKLGICFDYASLTACMLRVQGIPTKLVIGTCLPQNQYHAWNLAKVGDVWILLDATLRSAGYGWQDYETERYY